MVLSLLEELETEPKERKPDMTDLLAAEPLLKKGAPHDATTEARQPKDQTPDDAARCQARGPTPRRPRGNDEPAEARGKTTTGRPRDNAKDTAAQDPGDEGGPPATNATKPAPGPDSATQDR
jgi:hypothetical protein